MRIAIFTEKDYTFMFPEWVKLVRAFHSADHIVVGLYLFPTKLGKNSGLQNSLYYFRTFGLGTFFKLGTIALAARLKQIWNAVTKNEPFAYYDLANRSGLVLQNGENPNDPDVVEWVKKNNIDIIIISFGFIVKQPLIEAARVAIINKHSALLPAFRGLFPVFWAMLNGAPVGVTVHKVDSGVDTGEILYQKKYDYPEYHTVFKYYKKIYSDLADSLAQSIEIIEGKQKKQLIDFSPPPSYYSLPTTDDYKKFKQKGFRLV